uniref:Putative nucleolar and coiled-body phosphoprotein 1-like isoform x1 n=1 Tax=Ixodes ricinus TaxID=34613 RepID=A0A6B0VFG4_IXORI
MGAKRKPKAATKHAQQVSGLARTSVARSPTKRELSVVLERLEESLIFFPRIKTSTPLKSRAAVVALRLSDFSESESLSDEHEPQTKMQNLRKAEHTFMDDILPIKSDAVRARRNGAGTALAAREDVHPSAASEDDDTSYRPPSEADTESTSHESNSEWEEFTSDGTSSTSTEISNRPSSRMSTRAKHSVNGGASSGRRLQRLGLQSSRSKSDNIRAKASGQAHPGRPATGKELLDRDDGKVRRQQKKDTSRTKRKAALERRPGATKKQVSHSPGVKNIARNLKIVEQGSSSSWEESSSVKSMEDTESLTNSRDKRTQLRSVKQKQYAHPLFNDRKKGCHRITNPKVPATRRNSKVAATRREDTPRRSSRNSHWDSECSQERDTAQSGKGPLSTNRERSQHVTKMSKNLGSKRKRESNNSGSRKSEAATQPKDSESFRFAAKNLQTRSPAEPYGGYADRRKSLRARRESILSSQYSSDSPDDSDGEPSHLQRNAMSQSSKADIPIKRQSVNGSRIRLARKSTKVLLSEQESASSDSSEGWLPVQSQRSKWEESECSSGNEQRKSGSPLQRKQSSDFITLQAGKSQVARGRHVGAKRKNIPLSGSSSLLDESSDDLEDSEDNDGVRRGSRNKQTGPKKCHAQPARLARRQYIDTKEQRVRDSDRSEEWTKLDLESEEPKIFVGGKPPRTGNVHVQVRSRKPKDQITRTKGEDEISQDATTSLEGSGDNVPFSQMKTVTKPQSRQPATRKQTKLQAFAVGAKKKGRSRSPLVAGKRGESSHDHPSNSQESGGSSGNNWKSGIVQRSKRGVSSAHPGAKESRAHPMRLTKKKSIKRKRHPSSSSGHSIEEGLTTESETCQISSRDPRAKSSASKQQSLKSGIGATQEKENPVTRRSWIRTERDNNLTAKKQLQTVVVQVRSRLRPRGSSAAGRREATPPSLISGTTNSSSELHHSQKNKVARSKAVLGEQRGPQENSAQLKVNTSARKKSAKGRSRSSIEESVTSELEFEGDEGGLRVHSTGPEPRPVQPKTVVTKVGRKCMTGGSPVRAKDNDKSLRGSSSLSEVGSDGSAHLKRKASTQSQTENLPVRKRLRQRTAIPVKEVHTARGSVVAAGRTFSPFLSGPVHDDDHLEQSQKKLDVRPSKKSHFERNVCTTSQCGQQNYCFKKTSQQHEAGNGNCLKIAHCAD